MPNPLLCLIANFICGELSDDFFCPSSLAPTAADADAGGAYLLPVQLGGSPGNIIREIDWRERERRRGRCLAAEEEEEEEEE